MEAELDVPARDLDLRPDSAELHARLGGDDVPRDEAVRRGHEPESLVLLGDADDVEEADGEPRVVPSDAVHEDLSAGEDLHDLLLGRDHVKEVAQHDGERVAPLDRVGPGARFGDEPGFLAGDIPLARRRDALHLPSAALLAQGSVRLPALLRDRFRRARIPLQSFLPALVFKVQVGYHDLRGVDWDRARLPSGRLLAGDPLDEELPPLRVDPRDLPFDPLEPAADYLDAVALHGPDRRAAVLVPEFLGQG